jgi:hypothetical protein
MESTGYGPGHNLDVEIGVAYERSKEASEFGLPENCSDPTDYRAKAPACEKVIGS